VGEEDAHEVRILDGGDDAQPAAAAGPGEDSEIERTVHQRRPHRDGAGLAVRDAESSRRARVEASSVRAYTPRTARNKV
jgi:hypothetical protein